MIFKDDSLCVSVWSVYPGLLHTTSSYSQEKMFLWNIHVYVECRLKKGRSSQREGGREWEWAESLLWFLVWGHPSSPASLLLVSETVSGRALVASKRTMCHLTRLLLHQSTRHQHPQQQFKLTNIFLERLERFTRVFTGRSSNCIKVKKKPVLF